jgi:predicted phosphodiesterase
MIYAVTSDWHANLPAVRATLEDARKEGADRIICLGDVLGYGPKPIECLDLAMQECSLVTSGNHERAIIDGTNGFNIYAALMILWTREQILKKGGHDENDNPYLKYISELHTMDCFGEYFCAHGALTHPTDHYITPEQFGNSPDPTLVENFNMVNGLTFIGHLHIPFIGFSPKYCECSIKHDRVFELNASDRIFVNVGSVGQARDGSHAATYALVENGRVRLRRVRYDHEAAKDDYRSSGINEWVKQYEAIGHNPGVLAKLTGGILGSKKGPTNPHRDLEDYLIERINGIS